MNNFLKSKNIILNNLVKHSYTLLKKYENDEENIIYILLNYVFNIEKKDIFLLKDKILNKKDVKKYLKYLLKVLKKDYPVQYITKEQYFYNNTFKLNKKVLIPRFDTEQIIEISKNLINKGKVLEIGSGSGCIGISLKLLNNNFDITQTDISKSALKITKLNNKLLKSFNKVIRSNLFEKIDEKYDLIISNPPYLDINDYVSKNTKYEPKIALYAKNKGFEIIEKILKNFDKYLNINGYLLLETNTYHYNLILQKLDNKKYTIKNFKDYKNNQRFTLIRKNYE